LEQELLIVAGVDIGAATAKAVILNGNEVLSFSVMPTGFSVAKVAEVVIEEVLKKSGLSFNELEYVISTGYGRRAVSFANKASTEIICHAAGVSSLLPQARTIIDIGGLPCPPKKSPVIVLDWKIRKGAMDGQDNLHISYCTSDGTRGRLIYTTNTSGSWAKETADEDEPSVGIYCAIDVDPNGNPHISHYNYIDQDVRYSTRK